MSDTAAPGRGMLTPEVIHVSDQTVAEHVARIERDGYSIIEDAIEPALIESLHEDILRLEAELEAAPAQNPFEGFNTVRIYNLLARGALYQQIPVHEKVLPIAERVLDQGCLVSSLSSIAIGPGEAPQPMHADDQMFPLPRPHVPVVFNSMWAITDFTAENGATRFVPGTHKAVEFPQPVGGPEGTQAVMRRGSVLVYNGSLWHGGGANRSASRRIGIAMNYCAGWVRQQENQQIGIPLEIIRGFSPRLRKLVGFGLYKRILGHIDKCSPVDLLDQNGPQQVVGVF